MSDSHRDKKGSDYPSDCQILEGYRTRSQARSRTAEYPNHELLLQKAKPVKLLLLDVDGVLTDGSLVYSEEGVESKEFNTQDGLGIWMLQAIGVDAGLITARRSKLVQRRAEELSMKHIYQGVGKKTEAFTEILSLTGLKPFEVCYMGDDLIDLAILSRVGLSACPANSVPQVCQSCHLVTARPGGNGAVREVCDLIIQSHGAWDRLLHQFSV